MALLVFIPFEGYSPDGSAFGEGLDKMENVLPLHGGQRPLRQVSPQASVADSPVTGAIVHVFQAERESQSSGPDEDIGTNLVTDQDGGTVDIYQSIDEVSPEDTDRIIFGGAPASRSYGAHLGDVLDPTIHTGHELRYRYRIPSTTGAWDVEVNLMQGTSITIATDNPTGSGTTEWVQRTLAVTPTEAGNITNYSDLRIAVEITVAGAVQLGRPDADLVNQGWTEEGGLSTDLYQSIDEVSASDADYVESPPLALGGARRKLRVAIADLVNPYVPHQIVGDYSLRYRYQATNDGTTLTVRWGHGASTVIEENVHAVIASGSWIDVDEVILPSVILGAGDVDFADLWLEFEAHWPSAASSVATQIAVATADVNSLGFTPSGEATIWEAVAVDDADTAVSDGSSGAFFSVDAPAVDPGLDTAHLIRLKGFSSTAPSSAAGTAKLYQGTTLIYSENFTVTGVGTEVVFTINQSFASQISDYSALRLEVEDRKIGGALRISYVALETPEPRRVQVSWAEVEAPSEAKAEISWVRLFVPAVVTDYEGDKPVLYAGTRTKLWLAETGGFTDYSKGGGYAVGTEEPAGWRFASWGPEVLATNFGDPVQALPAGATQYVDAITAPSPAPKARFITTWRERVLLGDINLTGHAADEIWVSAPDDRSDFDPTPATRAGFQPVRSTPGQIMGLLGGQVGVIAKRNSLHAMLFTGTSVLYRLEEISRTVGVGYPNSLVGDANLFYFHSGGHFYRASVAGVTELIGSKDVSCFVLSTISQEKPTSMAEEDQRMVGARCPSTGLILWSLQAVGDAAWRHSRALLYNPMTDEWAFHTKPIDVSYLVTHPNSVPDDPSLFRGILGFTYDGTDIAWFRYSADEAYQATFRTKIRELPADPEAQRDPQTGRFKTAQVRQKRVVREVIPVISVPEGEAVPELESVIVEGFREMALSGYTEAETLTVANKNDRGVYHLGKGVPGFLHRFTAVLPEGYTGLAKVEGYYALYDLGGGR